MDSESNYNKKFKLTNMLTNCSVCIQIKDPSTMTCPTTSLEVTNTLNNPYQPCPLYVLPSILIFVFYSILKLFLVLLFFFDAKTNFTTWKAHKSLFETYVSSNNLWSIALHNIDEKANFTWKYEIELQCTILELTLK